VAGVGQGSGDRVHPVRDHRAHDDPAALAAARPPGLAPPRADVRGRHRGRCAMTASALETPPVSDLRPRRASARRRRRGIPVGQLALYALLTAIAIVYVYPFLVQL